MNNAIKSQISYSNESNLDKLRKQIKLNVTVKIVYSTFVT